ncbi:MAG: hypothetical protein Q9208_000856 [Pyrenodesmia sp. 3 TL-2023]
MAFLLNILLLPLVVNVLGQDASPSGPTHPGTISSCNKWTFFHEFQVIFNEHNRWDQKHQLDFDEDRFDRWYHVECQQHVFDTEPCLLHQCNNANNRFGVAAKEDPGWSAKLL